MSSGIRLNSDYTLTDHDIGPQFQIGSITDFGGESDGYMWVVPQPPNAPRLYTPEDLRQIAQILEDANKQITKEQP